MILKGLWKGFLMEKKLTDFFHDTFIIVFRLFHKNSLKSSFLVQINNWETYFILNFILKNKMKTVLKNDHPFFQKLEKSIFHFLWFFEKTALYFWKRFLIYFFKIKFQMNRFLKWSIWTKNGDFRLFLWKKRKKNDKSIMKKVG